MWSSPAGNWEVADARPHPRLRPGVLSYRGYRLETDGPRSRLEVPDGSATLLINFAEPLRVTSPLGVFSPRLHSSMVAGLRTDARVGTHDGFVYGMEVLLAPWMVYRLFGTGMHELAAVGVPTREVAGPWAGQLAGALEASPTWAERFELLDAALLTRLDGDGGRPVAARVRWAWEALQRTGGAIPVAELARRTGWTERYLQNRFREQIGLPPKSVARITRLQRALRLLEAGRPATEVAEACGFYDQAHFNRDFRVMTGQTPGSFLRARRNVDAPDSAPRSSVDRVHGQVTSVLLG